MCAVISVSLNKMMLMALGKKTFLGVFTRELPKPPSETYPQALIVNTDPANEPGEHWCGMFWDLRGKGYFFNPLGHPPLPEWVPVLGDGKDGTWQMLTLNVQPKSSTKCGLYVMLFLLRMYHSNPPVHICGITNLMNDVNELNVESLVKEFLLKLK